MAIVHITQYLRPSRRPALVIASIPDELAELAEKLVISCELLPDNHALIYAHRMGEDEEDELTELADNFKSENSPDIALERLIRRFEKKPFKPFLED